ncbi:MAG: serine/threonine-protein kinase [Polyangia bacterium]
MTDLVGKTLGRYRLVRLIGEGGMGGVYEGEHTMLGRKAAVKVLHPEFTKTRESVERFLREAQAASAIGHPNIIDVFDIGRSADNEVFMIMELLSGESLEQTLDREQKLPPDRAVAIVLQVLSALNAAHDKRIIHRDLKPGNVFLAIDKRGRPEVKLLDFGVAKIHGPEEADTSLTAPGTILGTPDYLSPEQARGAKEIDQRIDIWSAGVMLYEVLGGRLPFVGDTYNEVLGKILLDQPPPLRELRPDLPENLCAVVERAMAKSPDERYSSAAEMMQELSRIEGAAISLVSSGAAREIRSSIPPPPASESIPGARRSGRTQDIDLEETQPGAARAGAAHRSERHGETNSTPLSWGGGGRPRARRRALAAALGGAAVLAAIGIAVAFSFGGNRGQDPPAGESASVVAEPSSARTADATGDQRDAPATAAAAGDLDASADTEPLAVTIEIEGLPQSAEVTLDGEPADPPIETTRSDEPVILLVSAPGYSDFQLALTPDRDRTIAVDMERTGKRPESRQRKGRGKKQRAGEKTKPAEGEEPFKIWKPKKKKKDTLIDNPFEG